jgi:hypothetical protein
MDHFHLRLVSATGVKSVSYRHGASSTSTYSNVAELRSDCSSSAASKLTEIRLPALSKP